MNPCSTQPKKLQFIALAILIVFVLCAHSALSTTGYSATLTLGQHSEMDFLASKIDERQLQPPAQHIRFQPKPKVVRVAAR